jgi:hypothetical protein
LIFDLLDLVLLDSLLILFLTLPDFLMFLILYSLILLSDSLILLILLFFFDFDSFFDSLTLIPLTLIFDLL